jgi:glycerol-3-phosphate acyltransferase PlsY
MYQIALFALIGYLIGAIPFGLLLGKIFFKQDVRKIGSGGTGATNVLRLGSKWVALATMALDIAKVYLAWIAVEQLIIYMYGFFASSIILGIYGMQLKMVVAGAAVIGHCFPVYARFKGGKGVAAFAGAMILLAPLAFLASFATWVLMLAIFKKSSLAALIAGAFTPLYALFLVELPAADKSAFMWFVIALVLLVVARHAGNIRRLIRGEEPNVEFKKAELPKPAKAKKTGKKKK